MDNGTGCIHASSGASLEECGCEWCQHEIEASRG